ncbi:MAG: redox-sensing transcriptional repressor Rex [Anaerolineae bacterium]
MASVEKIPDIVVERLPLYLRALGQLLAQGKTITSSHELGQRLGISSAQIRKDLSQFGDFGKQGTGYQIIHLQTHLKQILKVDREWAMIVVGAGDLGKALTHYRGFVQRGFRVIAAFDNDPSRLGQVGDIEVMPTEQMTEFVKRNKVKIAMLAVPSEVAQEVADKLVDAGVRALLNYAPITLTVPAHVKVEYIDPVMHLQHMTYYLD